MINVAWDNDEQTIMRYEFLKGWSWTDLNTAFTSGYALLDSVPHTVDVIMDFTDTSMFAPSGAINQARRVTNNPRHNNLGLTAVVGSSFISGIFKLITKLTGTTSSKWDVTFVSELDEAYEAIKTYQEKRGALS